MLHPSALSSIVPDQNDEHEVQISRLDMNIVFHNHPDNHHEVQMSNYPHVRVVGMHFRGSHAKEYAAALQPGDKTLTLVREPENEADKFAIKVMAPGEEPWHLGYVERGAASFIAVEMDAGETFEVEVREVTTEGKNQIPVVSVNRV